MTQPPPSVPESARRNRNKWIVALVIGLVIVLVLGTFIIVIFNLPNAVQKEVGVSNEVQVSGTVSETRLGTIQFINWNDTTNTRYNHYASIMNEKYSILLVGGESYSVYIGEPFETGYSYSFSLYVPSNVTTFTVNF